MGNEVESLKETGKDQSNDRETLKILMASDRSILSGKSGGKDYEVELPQDLQKKKLRNSHSQSLVVPEKKFILNPNLGLREIILDPTRSSKVELRLDNTK